MDLRESEFDHVVELFYEAAAVPELWPQALEALADATGAMAANLMPLRPGLDQVITTPRTRGFIDQFVADGWLRINPYMRRGLELTAAGHKGLITSEDMLSPEEMAADPYVNEVEAPWGFGPKAGMVLVNEGPELVLPITIERSLKAGPFSRSEISVLNRLMAKIEAAARLAMAVGFSRAHGIAAALNHIGSDVVLLGRSGRVLFLSPGAERLIGDAVTIADGLISSWAPDAAAALDTAISRALTNDPLSERITKRITLPRQNCRWPVFAQVIPMAGAAHDVFMLARAAIVISDPEQHLRDDHSGTLGATYGFSRAESRFALRLAQGDGLKEIAEAEGIALETARSRLKAMFAKTGTHRQVELALLLARLTH